MPTTRLLRAALAAALLTTALAPLSSHGAGCADEKRRTRPDGWIALRRAAFSDGEQKVTDWAASPFYDGYVLATNGGSIARTIDAGCSWEEVWAPGVPVGESQLNAGATIFDVALSPSTGRLGHIAYAVVGDAASSRVVTSIDLGETWVEQPSAGLPVLKAVHSVHVSANPDIAYVVADAAADPLLLGTNVSVETGAYVTRDGGLSFAPANVGITPTPYTQIAVDPADPREVWAWDVNALYHSKDSAATFSVVDEADGPISTVDVSHFPPSEPARITAFRSRRALAAQSANGGRTWREIKTAGRITDAATLFSRDVLATASEVGVFVDSPSLKLVQLNLTPHKLILKDLAWSGGYTSYYVTLYASNGTDLYLRRLTPAIKDPVKPKLPPVDLRSPFLRREVTTLSPANAVIRLKPGERRTVHYTLDMAPVPTPLDIFFATDSTGSMSDVIASLRSDLQDIIDDLADSGIDVWFGVGDFKDYPAPYGGSGGDHPYKRFRAVGPIDDELEEAIAAIQIGGGNGLDSALAATYQAATGEGQRALNEAGEKAGWWVEPGEGAEWREQALKVVVIAADVRSRDPKSQPGYPGPTYKKVIDALNLLDIEHVGLAVGSDSGPPFQSLSRVSKGTRTVAPVGGTDCDSDGDVDVQEGMPLVCKLPMDGTGNGIAPAMIGLLKAIEDRQTVSIVLRGDPRGARLVSEAAFPSINVKADNVLKTTVEARCDRETAGETFEYGVDAIVGAQSVTKTRLTVVCAGIPVPRRMIADGFPPPAVRALVAAAVPPPPPPPQPVPQTNPNPNPQSNPNPNPQPATQVQVGAAVQQQAQVEVATARVEVHAEEELAMSGLRHDDAAAAGVLCAGMVLAAGAAVGLKRRTRPEVVPVRSSG